MSYILDALKKSDQQRQLGATPTLHTTQVTEAASRQPAFWWYGLLALGLVGAGIAIGSLGPSVSTHELPARDSVTAQSSDSNTSREAPAFRSPASQISGKSEIGAKGSAPRTLQRPIPTNAVIGHDESSHSRTAAQHVPRKRVASIPKGAAPVTARSKSNPPAPASRVIPMSELPLSIQRALPAMSISAHAYSSQPKDRLVSINDQLMREGAFLAPGLKLEEITPDGMIFGYKGYRFYHGVKSSAATARIR